MTTVDIYLAKSTETGISVLADTIIEFHATLRFNVEESVVIPQPVFVTTDENGYAQVVLTPTNINFVWRIREKTHGGDNFYVEIPDTTEVLAYNTLTRIDPTTLTPEAQLAAWHDLQEQIDNIPAGPKGDKGDTGEPGPQGEPGTAAPVPTAVRYTPTLTATGLTYTGNGTTAPCYDSHYVKNGQLVTFHIKINMSTVTNFGTGQFKLTDGLPFAPLSSASSHFAAWAWINPANPADELNGHIQVVADHLPNSTTLDLHWIKETTAAPKPVIESLLEQGVPVTFTTNSIIYINGTYITEGL